MGFLSNIFSNTNAVQAINSGSQLISNHYNRKLQREENALDREFNASEAEKNRQFQLDMFNAANEWNSYSNQSAEMRKAGLNPNMMYSQGGAALGNASASNGSAASSSSHGLPPSIAPSFDPLASAQADLIKAQRDNVDADTQSKKIDNSWKDRLNESEYELNRKNADYLVAQMGLSYRQADSISQDIHESNSRIQKNSAEISLINEQAELVRKQNSTYMKQFEAQLSQIAASNAQSWASASLSTSEANKIAEMLPLLIDEKTRDIAIKELQSFGLRWQNEQLRIETKYLPDKLKRVNANTRSSTIKNYVNCVTDVVESATNIMKSLYGTGGL